MCNSFCVSVIEGVNTIIICIHGMARAASSCNAFAIATFSSCFVDISGSRMFFFCFAIRFLVFCRIYWICEVIQDWKRDRTCLWSVASLQCGMVLLALINSVYIPTDRYTYKTTYIYSLRLILPVSTQILHTASAPPTRTKPIIAIAISPTSSISVCTASVHTTALIPPYTAAHHRQLHM